MILSNEDKKVVVFIDGSPFKQLSLSDMLTSLPQLEKGSIVDIVAPASACDRSELKKAIAFVKDLGLEPRVSPKIFHGQTKIVAATDEQRFEQLKKALLAKDSSAIWCIRGG